MLPIQEISGVMMLLSSYNGVGSKSEKCFQPISSFVYIINYQSNTQKTIENKGKITFHPGRKQRSNHRPFAVEKNSSHKKTGVASGISLFQGDFCTFR